MYYIAYALYVHCIFRYDNPILVSTTKDPRLNKGKRDEKTNLTPTEDILNSILPPREWTDEGQLWVQYVSSTPATRSDVITLQEHLDQKLQQRQARETGICPIRYVSDSHSVVIYFVWKWGKYPSQCDLVCVLNECTGRVHTRNTRNHSHVPTHAHAYLYTI